MRFIRASVNVFIGLFGVLLFTGALMTSMAATTTDVAVASTVTGSGMFNPRATLDTAQIDDLRPVATDTATDDARAEGTEALPSSYRDTPWDLWNALIEQYPGSYDDGPAGVGTFMVPMGSVVETDARRYLATLDGWAEILSTTTAGEYRVIMLDIPTRTAVEVYGTTSYAQCGTDAQCAALAADRATAALGTMTLGAESTVQNVAQVTTTAPPVQLSRQCVRAARDILHASLSRYLRVEEDLSYREMPKRVGQCNDQLAAAYFADGRQMVNGRHDHKALRSFLRTVIRTGELPAVSVRH